MTTVLSVESPLNTDNYDDFNSPHHAFIKINESLLLTQITLELIEQLVQEGMHQCGLGIIQSSFDCDNNNFIHGTVILTNAQIGIHVWPEQGIISICFLDASNKIDFEDLVSNLSFLFNAKNYRLDQTLSQLTSINSSSKNLVFDDSIVGVPQVSCNLSKLTSFTPGKTLDWVYEYDEAGEQHQFKVKSILAMGESKFQQYAILDTYAYGVVLFLDGYVQSAQKDEHIYHECLVQPAMLAHPNPKKALVIGAGEGASAREIIYHPSIERVVLIDLDEELINQCDEFLPTFHRGSFHHPKVELLFQDGYTFLENTNERFDVIIIDVVDAIEEGPAQKLYTREFYQFLKTKCLTENGIVVVQSMEMNDVDLKDDWHVHREMAQSFKNVCSYATFVPSFWSKWRYTIASDAIDLNTITSEQLNSTIQQRGIADKLNYFSGEVFPSLRGLSKQARQRLTEVLDNPNNMQTEADISKHFIDWDLEAYLMTTRGKSLD